MMRVWMKQNQEAEAGSEDYLSPAKVGDASLP